MCQITLDRAIWKGFYAHQGCCVPKEAERAKNFVFCNGYTAIIAIECFDLGRKFSVIVNDAE